MAEEASRISPVAARSASATRTSFLDGRRRAFIPQNVAHGRETRFRKQCGAARCWGSPWRPAGGRPDRGGRRGRSRLSSRREVFLRHGVHEAGLSQRCEPIASEACQKRNDARADRFVDGREIGVARVGDENARREMGVGAEQRSDPVSGGTTEGVGGAVAVGAAATSKGGAGDRLLSFPRRMKPPGAATVLKTDGRRVSGAEIRVLRPSPSSGQRAGRPSRAAGARGRKGPRPPIT